MTTNVLERGGEGAVGSSRLARWLALEATVPAVLFASAAIVIGLHWDIAWHRSIGRDTFWSPPHVLEQIAAMVAGLFCGWRVIYTSFLGTDADRAGAVRFWRVFHGPLGGWLCIWGTIAMISSAPFDDWWHAAYGLDVEILTPPHVFLLVGMITVQLGAMLMMAAEQNRTGQTGGRTARLFAGSMGLVVLMAATMVYTQTALPNHQHQPGFYQTYAALILFFLATVARAGRSRWPATTAALTYMAIMVVMNWILAVVPATPKLAPIYNPVTTLVPPGFPVLLVFPALAVDWLLRARLPTGSPESPATTRREALLDWVRAPAAGVLFVAILLAVQWPWSTFLLSLDQPNYLLGVGYWDYNVRLGPWTRSFFDVPGYTWIRGRGPVGSLDLGAMAAGLAWAAGFGAIAARVGLWWGNWMRRVVR